MLSKASNNSGSQKVDSLVTEGLEGVSDSLAYRVHEIEKHLHNVERWLGEHAARNAEVDCGQTGILIPFQANAGNDTWGPIPLCVLGTADTPVIAGKAKFDLHRFIITDVANTGSLKTHYIQVIYGSGTVAAAIAAGQFTEFMVTPVRDGSSAPRDVMFVRQDAGTKVWVRHWVDGVNTCTMDFYIGIHEYVG